MGRSRSFPDRSGIGSYQVGPLTKVLDGGGTTLFQYDHRGNLTVKRQAIGTTTTANLTYVCNLARHVTQMPIRAAERATSGTSTTPGVRQRRLGMLISSTPDGSLPVRDDY